MSCIQRNREGIEKGSDAQVFSIISTSTFYLFFFFFETRSIIKQNFDYLLVAEFELTSNHLLIQDSRKATHLNCRAHAQNQSWRLTEKILNRVMASHSQEAINVSQMALIFLHKKNVINQVKKDEQMIMRPEVMFFLASYVFLLFFHLDG